MDEYRTLAEEFKDRGNASFQAGDMQQAISLYTQAIELDPDNYVYYSNRSAAYMKADSTSKALKDAERCVELNPSFIKGAFPPRQPITHMLCSRIQSTRCCSAGSPEVRSSYGHVQER